MKTILTTSTLLILFFFALGCTNEQTSSIQKEYDYDEVLHYHVGRRKTNVIRTEEKDYALRDFLNSPIRNGLKTYLPEKLTGLGFAHDTVPEKNFSKLNSILDHEPMEENLQTECVPFYRDVLIFRKRKEIVKIAQLCFQCGQSEFIGPWPNMTSFGQ